MCRRVTERFFHNCGHVERTEISTINPECIEETHIVLYDGGKFALFAFGADSSPSTGFPRNVPRRGRQGRVQTVILQNADNCNAITEDNLWASRQDLIELLNSWQRELLGEKYQERNNELREDDISRGVLIQHQLYDLGPGPLEKNFLRKLQPQEVPEDKGNKLFWWVLNEGFIGKKVAREEGLVCSRAVICSDTTASFDGWKARSLTGALNAFLSQGSSELMLKLDT
ncbi:hypothetical protein BGZ57DRAFT_953182 [Hyaloscypha finlandica]|nr:hypothetical protein BGZ57DRAFT_953182 [Hyaloscypha finlandica]